MVLVISQLVNDRPVVRDLERTVVIMANYHRLDVPGKACIKP